MLFARAIPYLLFPLVLALLLVLPGWSPPAEAGSSPELEKLERTDKRLTDRIQRAHKAAKLAEEAARGIPDIRTLEADVRKAITALRPVHCKPVQDAIDVLEASYTKGKADVERFEAGVTRVNAATYKLKTEADREHVYERYTRVDEIYGKIQASVKRAKANFEAYERAQAKSDRDFLAAADRLISELETKLRAIGDAHRRFMKHRNAVEQRRRDVFELGREMKKVRATVHDADLSEKQRRFVNVMMTAAANTSKSLPAVPALPKGAWYSEKSANAARANLEYHAKRQTARRCVKDISAYTRIERLGRRADKAAKSTASGRKRAEDWHIWDRRKIQDVLDDIKAGRSKGRLKYLISIPLYYNKYIFVDPYGDVVEMSGALRGPRRFNEAAWFKDATRTSTKPAKDPWSRKEYWKRAPKTGDDFRVYRP